MIFYPKKKHNSTNNNLIITHCQNFSASGCPIAARNKMRILESGGSLEQHKAQIAAAQAAAAAAVAMKYDGNICTTSDGGSANGGGVISSGSDGHMSSAFLTQR